jgi:hypothetical protein
MQAASSNPAAVQRILRHTDLRLTVEVYAHLAPNDLRSEIDLLSFQKHDPGEPDPERPAQRQRSIVYVPLMLPYHKLRTDSILRTMERSLISMIVSSPYERGPEE